MSDELIKNAAACYQLAEQKAGEYFKTLYVQVMQKTYIPALTKDIQSWKQNHLYRHTALSFRFRGRKKAIPKKGYHNYLQWLNYTGKLENYLERSISYIFLRDLGKDLDTMETQEKIRHAVDKLKNHLTFNGAEGGNQPADFTLAGLYRAAQKEGIESAVIWVIEKLKSVSANIPEGMDAENAQRKLIKIIAGVLMHVMDQMDDEITTEERTAMLDQAIRLGYSYGLTYPFIDDLLDAQVLSGSEKKQFADFIRTTLISGSVPPLQGWTGNNLGLIQYIHAELEEAYETIKVQQNPETIKSFSEQAYVFFQSQETDRQKVLANGDYTNEELYIPIILKSSFSRLIVRSVINAPRDEGFTSRTFFYGLYNQLADDFTDMFDDLKDGAVTPYTYYMKYHKERPDLLNPFELYWAVISHLIRHVYHADTKTREVILDRAINGLKRFKERMGIKKYNEVMELFAAGNAKFNQLLQKMVWKADDVDFFDKLLRDQLLNILRIEREAQEDFYKTIQNVRAEINKILFIPKTADEPLIKEPIIEAANHSLKGEGKRLRPIMTWVMGVHQYGFQRPAILPLLRSLEYMHTASLIFDDLPSQDNASTRRGRQTLHQLYNIAIAELTGLYLTQKAVEEQASLDQFEAKTVLLLIQYSAQTVEAMVRGQAMDLDSKGTQLTLEELNNLCFYKTGIAFEASLVMPAILARTGEQEMEALKKYSYHAGIAFQIKDDLLDDEGDPSLLGKPVRKDRENNNSTFVTVLGSDAAKKAMWEHYCLAFEALQKAALNTPFLKQLLKYMINRDH